MIAFIDRWPQRSNTRDKTSGAVERQAAAMDSELFEVGLYDPDPGTSEPIMIPRVWDSETIIKSVPWLRYQNREGRNIYIRPKGEHNLSMVDDLTKDAVSAMMREGFAPALIVETSPGNYQAWLKHHERLDKEVSTAVARELAEKFGGDRGAADWRHFGRLSGFTNRKPRHLDTSTGLYPFVRLIEASGGVYPEAERFLAAVKGGLDRLRIERESLRKRAATGGAARHADLKNIDMFRADARYGGDGTRIDLAYAVYAFSRGITATEVEAAIRSRDLAHKGTERRQNDYVERTIKKALASIDRGR
jgi:RepB DNA-primase from phage plasmid